MNATKPTYHRMGRRTFTHDYSLPGIYHITIHVADDMGQPLGAIVGEEADRVAVSLTDVGETVRRELTTAITAHYPMITIDEHVIMPDHLHFILIVRDPIVSKSGRPTHLGQVIAGFKTGCNRAYWAATRQTTQVAKPQGALTAATAAAGNAGNAGGATAGAAPSAPVAAAPSAPGGAASSAPGGSAAKKARYDTGRPPLFAPGYCDVQPIEPGQLETQRAYIRNNPRSRWLRSHDRTRLQTHRGGIDTAVTPAALRGYLQRECPPSLATDEALSAIERRLLLAGGSDTPYSKTAGRTAPTIICDSYGDRALLTEHRCLPVVCHRKDAARFNEQKARCFEEASRGAVLVSACISPKEREIINESTNRGFATILVADNGFPNRYHPSTERIDLCAAGRLLLVTPWQYQYRLKDDPITVPFCRTMNCVVQALCRKKDDWWKTPA